MADTATGLKGATGHTDGVSPATDRAAAARDWLERNTASLREWDAWVEANGLPLAQYRAQYRAR